MNRTGFVPSHRVGRTGVWGGWGVGVRVNPDPSHRIYVAVRETKFIFHVVKRVIMAYDSDGGCNLKPGCRGER